ncbi:MAG: hypothetical protein HPY83_10860 [Anaerolineae bacterium]|nr:hypothetical protein [Anaerolineae bacterium]
MPSSSEDLERLAEVIRARNAIETEIAAITGRPAQLGHVGEYMAPRVFGIDLVESASQRSIDGYFRQGPLAGSSVDVKSSTKQDGLLNLSTSAEPDFYLVLTGSRQAPGPSRGQTRPWTIESVYLFEARELIAALRELGVGLGIATGVRRHLWQRAEPCPVQRNLRPPLSEQQRQFLRRFAGQA